MNIQAKLIVVALSCITASCGAISADIQESDGTSQMTESFLLGASKSSSGSTAAAPAAPAGEVANYVNAQMQKFRRLKSYDSDAIVVDGNAKVPGGRFVGNLVLDQKRTSLIGSGVGQTVIDGNLIIGSQCSVTGLTVTGDVIFSGNNAFVSVQCFGQVLDYGMQNRY